MFLKKVFSIISQIIIFSVFAYTHNQCAKWLPLSFDGSMVIVIPIYDTNIVGADLDCDGILDDVDLDIDGDGITNGIEHRNGTNPRKADSDGDGVDDGSDIFPLDAHETIDTDNDGIGNNADTDDDNDGFSDVIEIAQGSNSLDASSTLDDTYFIITVETSKNGSSRENQFIIPTDDGSHYNYNVDCDNDGINEATNILGNYTCSYESAGRYTIVIKDNTTTRVGFPHLYFNNEGDREKIVGINQWGTMKWNSMKKAFYGCSNMNDTGGEAVDIPNLNSVIDLSYMFAGATRFNQDISAWDTSHIIYMHHMFDHALSFNQDIGSWDTHLIVDMNGMFIYARQFNQDIGNWNTSLVVDMHNMFSVADTFNQDIGSWDTHRVNNMSGLFSYAIEFNQDIGDWNTSMVQSMDTMFSGAREFNQNISLWDVSMVVSMDGMFHNASLFNQDLTQWYDNVSLVESMNRMFYNASSFNQSLDTWEIQESVMHTDFSVNSDMISEPNW